VTALELVNMTDLERYVRNEESMLMVNIKGCGYPPSIKCKNFTENYGYEGATFPCHYSRQNKSVVMPHYERNEQIAVIRNYFVIPFIVTVLSSIGLCVIHCDCRFKKERRRRKYRRPKVENLR
jgi:Na+ channel auxiliary subunit TipE